MDCTGFGTLFNDHVKHALSGLIFSFAGFGAATNLLSFVWLFQMRNQLSKTNQILLALVFSDVFTCLIALPIQAVRLLSDQLISNLVMEQISFHCTMFSFWFSTFIVCLVAYDRFILLLYVSRYDQLMTKKKLRVLIFVAFLVSLFFPGLKLWKPQSFAPFHIIVLILPNIWLPVAYYLIVKKVNAKKKKLKDKSSNSSNQEENEKDARKNIKNTKPIVILIFVYFMCSIIPVIAAGLYIANRRLNFMSVYAHDWVRVFGLFGMTINSCINPIIYAMRMPFFKTKKDKFVQKYLKSVCFMDGSIETDKK